MAFVWNVNPAGTLKAQLNDGTSSTYSFAGVNKVVTDNSPASVVAIVNQLLAIGNKTVKVSAAMNYKNNTEVVDDE